jgi:hypothetical protein
MSLCFVELVSAQAFLDMPTSGPGAYAPATTRIEVAPDVGEQIPDVSVVDRNGDPVNLRDMTREHYTVLVLGCLT